MNDERPLARKRGRALRALAIALGSAWLMAACFGDKVDPGITDDDGTGGVDDGGQGGSGKGGSSGSSRGGGDVGGEAGDATGGTSGSAGAGGRGGTTTGGTAGAATGGDGGDMGGPMCGDDHQDPGEQCDDGNELDGDDCSWNCTTGCADCYNHECALTEDPSFERSFDPCFDDDTLAMGGPAANVAFRWETCTALLTCAHRTGCGWGSDGTWAADECYCLGDQATCGNPNTFVPGPCKQEVEEAAETTIPGDLYLRTANDNYPVGRSYWVLNFCEISLCKDQCRGGSGGMGGMGGMGGIGGMSMGGAGMGGRASAGMGGMSGGGTGGSSGRGGAGTSGSGGSGPRCGDGMVNGSEDCEPPATLTCSYRCRDLASAACEDCEIYAGCNEIALGCDAVAGTNSAGKPRRELCYEMSECIFATGCAASSVEACFCGNVPNAQCQNLAPGTAMGACARTMEAAFETTLAADVLVNFSNVTLGGSWAAQRALCDQANCNAECF